MLSNIPAHMITGFLGSGKTTAISHLLGQKPEDERWAVLVNEFGETGIDGQLFEGEDSGVHVREVPGGCMCCAAGVPMQVALNQLLARARPHRLLIEPTGLGHPRQMLRTLTGENFASVLDLRSVITLVDARKLADTRYTGHRVFDEQLRVADRILANKADLYSDADRQQLDAFFDADPELRDKPRQCVTRGQVDAAWLDPGQAGSGAAPLTLDTGTAGSGETRESSLPDAGFEQTFNEGEDHVSSGWRFSGDLIFDYELIHGLIRSLPAERIKAVVHTNQGPVVFNRDGEQLDTRATSARAESRLEFIARERTSLDSLEARLRACLTG